MFFELLGRRPDGIGRADPIREGGAHVGLIELLIIILVILWLLGYFGRGRFYATGPATTTGTWYSGNVVHLLLVIVVVLVILRLLRIL